MERKTHDGTDIFEMMAPSLARISYEVPADGAKAEKISQPNYSLYRFISPHLTITIHLVSGGYLTPSLYLARSLAR